jgi:peptide/nickel transport system permease protein
MAARLAAVLWRPLRTALRDPYAAIGTAIYLLLILVAIFADHIATHDPLEILFTEDGALKASLPATAEHLLGTTNLGRDIFSQLVLGSRGALAVGLTAAACVVAVGTLIGLISGYFGGRIDMLLMRLADVALGIPFLPFVIVLSAVLGPKISNVVIAVALLLWPNTARVIRSQVLTLREQGYVRMARLSGLSSVDIMFKEIMPNLLPYLAASFVGSASGGILAAVGLEALGLGPQQVPTLGMTIYYALQSSAIIRGMWWWWGGPTLILIIMFTGFFLITIGLDEVANPRLRGARA